MTVPAQTPLKAHSANGVTTVFPYDFLVLDASTMKVYVNGVVLTSGYSVSGLGSPTGGNVTFTTAPANGSRILLVRLTPLSRDTDFTEDLLAAVLNRDADRVWMALQEFINGSRGSTTAIRVPDGETVGALPESSSRAGKVLAFDAGGAPIVMELVDVDGVVGLSFAGEVLTATEGQTDFALLTTSYVPGTNSLTVNIGGMFLNSEDLTELTSTTFRIAAGQPAGTRLFVRTGRTVTTGVAGDAVGFTPTGTGAVARNAQAKLREWVSVADFGADTTGVSDSTAAIQAAINASAGRAVLFPKGSYKITAALNVITNGISLIGEQFGNVTLIQHTDNTPFITIGDGTLPNRVTRATVENFQFIPRPGAANWTTAYAIEASYASFLNLRNLDVYGLDSGSRRIFGGIKFDLVSFSNIYDCWVRSIRGNGLFTVGASGNLTADIRMQSVYVLDFEGNGFHFSDFTNGHFVVNALAVTSVGLNGVYVDSNSATGGVNFFFTNLNMELSGTTCDGVTLNRGSLIQFQDGWWGASTGKSAVRIASGVSNVTFNGPWTTEGRWSIEGTNVKVHGPGNIGTLAPAASAAVSIVGATASLVDIKDMAISQFTGGGVEATGTPTDVSIEGNDFTLLGGGTPISGTLGARSQVTNNRGDTSRGAAASISVGSSPFTHTAGQRPESVHITGGTVSAIVVNGVTISAATNHTVQLPPNTAVTVTYSSIPTMSRIPQ